MIQQGEEGNSAISLKDMAACAAVSGVKNILLHKYSNLVIKIF